MKRSIFDIILAFTVGALSTVAFFSLYGLIASFSIKSHLSAWIFKVPKNYRVISIYVHEIFLQILSILPIIAILGTILGLVVLNRPKKYGLISLLSAILTFLYIQFIHYDFGYVGLKYTPIWSYVAQITLWAVPFVLFPAIGYRIKMHKSNIK